MRDIVGEQQQPEVVLSPDKLSCVVVCVVNIFRSGIAAVIRFWNDATRYNVVSESPMGHLEMRPSKRREKHGESYLTGPNPL